MTYVCFGLTVFCIVCLVGIGAALMSKPIDEESDRR